MEGLKNPGKRLVFEGVMDCPAGCQFGNGQRIAKFCLPGSLRQLNEVDLPQAGLVLPALKMAHDRDEVLEMLGGQAVCLWFPWCAVTAWSCTTDGLSWRR
jgi:hypothetical protein